MARKTHGRPDRGAPKLRAAKLMVYRVVPITLDRWLALTLRLGIRRLALTPELSPVNQIISPRRTPSATLSPLAPEVAERLSAQLRIPGGVLDVAVAEP